MHRSKRVGHGVPGVVVWPYGHASNRRVLAALLLDACLFPPIRRKCPRKQRDRVVRASDLKSGDPEFGSRTDH